MNRKVFVTGGTGFLGQEIVRQLLDEGCEVMSFSRGKNRTKDERVTHQQGSLNDYEILKEAMQGCEAVFHIASKVGIWGSYDSFFEVNVTGTKNIIKACLELQIPNLIFTSSASVVYEGNSEGEDERLPYPKKFDAYYPKTKALAEQAVIAANSKSLTTCSLRPHLIWGPRDPHILPALAEKQENGRLRNLTKGKHLIDSIYIENAAQAHLQAFKVMLDNPSIVGGKVYFISQDQPIAISEFVNRLLDAGGFPPVKKSINTKLALFLGWGFQTVFRMLRIKSNPPITLFIAKQFSSSHWYNISAAKRDLNYFPRVSIDEGMKRLKKWVELNGLRNDVI